MNDHNNFLLSNPLFYFSSNIGKTHPDILPKPFFLISTVIVDHNTVWFVLHTNTLVIQFRKIKV